MDAVKFILSEHNCSMMSWGTKSIKILDNETVVLPKLIRKQSRPAIYEYYQQKLLKTNEDIKRSTFYNLIKKIKFADQDIFIGLDYVTNILVTEAVELLKYFINKTINNKDIITNKLIISKTFLKHKYTSNFYLETYNERFHSFSFGLNDPPIKCIGEYSNKYRVFECNTCKYPFYVCIY